MKRYSNLWRTRSLCALMIGCFCNQAFARVKSKARFQPIVLQIQVSHPRNTDQTSLIFKQNRVELVTNVFQANRANRQASGQGSKKAPIRLGYFYAPLNESLRLLKRKVQVYKRLLRHKGKGIDLTPAMNAAGAETFDSDPHAPLIRLGGGGQSIEVRQANPYFKPLRNILRQAQAQQWACLSCAEYKKRGKHIVRTFRKKGRKPASIILSRQNLQCLHLGQNRMECLDHQFGLFELE